MVRQTITITFDVVTQNDEGVGSPDVDVIAEAVELRVTDLYTTEGFLINVEASAGEEA